MFFMIFGWIAKLFTGGALRAISNFFLQKEAQKMTFLGTTFSMAVNAEIEMRKVVAQERAALWLASPSYRILTMLIVGPPALHMAAIFIDTLFEKVYIPFYGYYLVHWGIAAAPAPYDQWEGAIVLGFVGVTTMGTSIVGAASKFVRGK